MAKHESLSGRSGTPSIAWASTSVAHQYTGLYPTIRETRPTETIIPRLKDNTLQQEEPHVIPKGLKKRNVVALPPTLSVMEMNNLQGIEINTQHSEIC